jgi:hypothetical protein
MGHFTTASELLYLPRQFVSDDTANRVGTAHKWPAALESMGKKPFSIGSIPPTPKLERQYFDDSTGVGDSA